MTDSTNIHGPFRIGRGHGYANLNGDAIRDARNLVVAVAIRDVPELDSDDVANLIAAGPDMYAALKDIWRLQHDGCTDDRWDAAWKQAEAAMDRAEGKS
jgi:hypothetical protein